ncbi:MAG: pyridoxal phosphate-dependent aminotransferase [Methylococcales bacterium]|nr:pyridoxal phosphate-dependent aminotransferase [Methylococcales bacterium]
MRKRLAERNSEISSFYVMELLRRAKYLEAQGRDVIHMEIGEPDFPTPPGIIDAGIKHLRTGEVKYTAAAGLPELRKKIAAFYQQRYGVNVDDRRIFVTPGASGAFLLALGVSLNPDEELLMADPCYPCNSNFATLLGGKPRTIAVDADNHYQLTAKQIEAHWTPHTKGVLVASPSNPTGTLIKPEELKKIIYTTNSLGGCFYSDEIYHGLVYGTQANTALAFSDDVFVINSFSKYFGMTGWRIGWLVVPDEFIDATEKLAQNIYIATSTQSQYAALAAFDDSTLAELEYRRAKFAERRDFLYDKLLNLGFKIPIKPEGAFYIYADCSPFSNDSFQFALDFLETEAVALTPGKDFGAHNSRQMLRFAYTTSIANMTIAIQRLERFINR